MKEATSDPEYSHPDMPWMDEVRESIASWSPDRPELHAQLSALVNNPGADVGLPVWYLNHAPLVHYYWLFCSSWDSFQVYATFDADGGIQGSSSSGAPGSSSADAGIGAGALPCPSMRLFQSR